MSRGWAQALRRWWNLAQLRRRHTALCREIERAEDWLLADHDRLSGLMARRFVLRQRLLQAGPLQPYLTRHTPAAQAAVVHALRRPAGHEPTVPDNNPAHTRAPKYRSF